MQHDFDKVDGILSTTVGYTGGTVPNPTYQQVSTGTTGHYEAIQITFNPAVISYRKLVDIYWHDIDPTDPEGEFCDHGNEYHSVIFYGDETQKKIAMESMDQLLQSKQFSKIYTQILPATTFYPAEEYHQKYSDKNPQAYAAYRSGCQRDTTLEQVWKK
jgi:peptide-methionine (S)-S-oxide reductase